MKRLISFLLTSIIWSALFAQQESTDWEAMKLQVDTAQSLSQARILYKATIDTLLKVLEKEKIQHQSYQKSLGKNIQEAETQKNLILVGFILAGIAILFTVYLIIRGVRQKDLLVEKQNIIEEQNHELQAQAEELRQQQEEITAQRDDIIQKNLALAEKNKLIEESIQMAAHIQKMVLESQINIENIFRNVVVWSKPRDIVSGDFYWVGKVNNTTIIALVDCMGHGVSAAFISLIIQGMLKEIVLIKKQFQPQLILEELNETLQQTFSNNHNTNGYNFFNITADVAICCIHKTIANDFSINFAGARRPLLYITESQVMRFKGSRLSISSMHTWEEEFEEEVIELPSHSKVYLFSDGITDQNNEVGKKFTEQKLINILQANVSESLQEQVRRIEKAFAEHQGKTPQRDDILFLAIEL